SGQTSCQRASMIRWLKGVDWRVPAIWAALFAVSIFARAYVQVADSGHRIGLWQAVMQEVASHLMVALMLPALYWLHRRFPVDADWRNIVVHCLAIAPFNIIRTVGMTGLRLFWFVDVLGMSYSMPLTWDRLFYEFTKDVVN